MYAHAILADVIADAYGIARTCPDDSPAVVTFAGSTADGDFAAVDITRNARTRRISLTLGEDADIFTDAYDMITVEHARASITRLVAALVRP